MDELDRKLLALLRADARAAASVLAGKLKVSRGTVQNRIERMISRGVIRGFTVKTRPDMERERVRAIMSIAIEGERSGAVLRALRGVPEIVAVHSTNGRWDLVAELDTDTLQGFSRVLDHVRTIEGIASTETSLLLETYPLA